MPQRLERLTAERLSQLPRERTVFFFPVGPLEDHGPHLPLGLDLMEADRLCWLLGERLEKESSAWTTVLMPAAPLGIDASTRKQVLTVRPHVMRDWLVDGALALHRMGFRHFVAVSGQLGPRQLTAIEEAATLVRKRVTRFRPWKRFGGGGVPVLIPASSALIEPSDLRRSWLFPDPREHGGERDTAVALELDRARGETTVDESYLALKASANAPGFGARALRWFGGQTEGYWGPPPADARPEVGEALLHRSVDQLVPKILAVLNGASPGALFRSGFARNPFNRSFFAAWALSISIVLLVMAWVYLVLSSFSTA